MPPAIKWLPSERRWLDSIANSLFDGEILLVRAQPRWGLSSAAVSISADLGETAVSAKGSFFTEEDQKGLRLALDAKITETAATAGVAQLIFDDYGTAVRRSQGRVLHSVLYRLLVDGGYARDIGALLLARTGDTLDFNFAGSPLLGRARMVPLPLLTEEDAEELGHDLTDLQQHSGESTWLARRFIGATIRSASLDIAEYLNNNRRKLVEGLPAGAIEVIVGAKPVQQVDEVSRDALRSLGCLTANGGEFSLAKLVRESRLPNEIRLDNPGWPASREESVNRFVKLLEGADDAIWVDRYLFSCPQDVRRFLEEVQSRTSARIRILVSRDTDRPRLDREIASSLAGMQSVEVRFMTRSDRALLHDRHLILPAMRSGFVLPTGGVVLARESPGSAVSVAMPALAINYNTCWCNGAPVFP